jgi:hypothetical protein
MSNAEMLELEYLNKSPFLSYLSHGKNVFHKWIDL